MPRRDSTKDAILRARQFEIAGVQIAQEKTLRAIGEVKAKEKPVRHQRGWNRERTKAIPFCGYPTPGALVIDPLKVTCPDCIRSLKTAGILT